MTDQRALALESGSHRGTVTARGGWDLGRHLGLGPGRIHRQCKRRCRHGRRRIGQRGRCGRLTGRPGWGLGAGGRRFGTSGRRFGTSGRRRGLSERTRRHKRRVLLLVGHLLPHGRLQRPNSRSFRLSPQIASQIPLTPTSTASRLPLPPGGCDRYHQVPFALSFHPSGHLSFR